MDDCIRPMRVDIPEHYICEVKFDNVRNEAEDMQAEIGKLWACVVLLRRDLDDLKRQD